MRDSSSLVDMKSGVCAGISQVLVGHPFDTLKVRLQTDGHSTTPLKYLRVMLRTEGPLSLYKGLTPPLVGAGFCTAIVFSTNEIIRNMLQSTGKPVESIISGALTGALMAGIISPMELLKIRMQVQGSLNSPKKYSGIIECLAKTIKHEGGPKSLYRGYTATIFRDAPSYAAYFGTYQYLKDLSESPTVIHQLLAGGIAGIAAWLPAYPQDVIKSQMQLNSDCRLGFLQASKSLYKRDGFPGFFKGITPTLARAFPANAACFYAFELSRHFLQS